MLGHTRGETSDVEVGSSLLLCKLRRRMNQKRPNQIDIQVETEDGVVMSGSAKR